MPERNLDDQIGGLAFVIVQQRAVQPLGDYPSVPANEKRIPMLPHVLHELQIALGRQGPAAKLYWINF
jgi:hypothetical protein